MKSFRFRKEARVSSDAVTKKPNLLRRFAHKAKKIFHQTYPSAAVATSTPTTPPAQLQKPNAQLPSIINEDAVLASAEWLVGPDHPMHALAPPRMKTTRQQHEGFETPTPSDRASSEYSQLGLDRGSFSPRDSGNTTTTAITAISADLCNNGDSGTSCGPKGKNLVHARGQLSHDIANGSFFPAVNAEGQNQHETTIGISTTADAKHVSAPNLCPVPQSDASEANWGLTWGSGVCDEAESGQCHRADRFKDVERLCRQRAVFGARLETELKSQKESLEADFEKCYDTSDRLHEIDILNLKDDHEAELKDLQEERDAALAEIIALTLQKDKLDLDVKRLNGHVGGLEQLVGQRTEERDCLRCQVDLSAKDNHDLLSEIGHLRQAVQKQTTAHEATAQLEVLKARHYETLSQLDLVGSERNALQIQNADLARQCQEVYAAYEAERKEKDSLKRQLIEFVEEKGKDFSWHIRENKNHLTLQSEDEEQAESNATAVARELHRREAQKALSVRAQIAELSSKNEAELKQQARAIEDLSEEASFNATALEASLAEQSHLVKTHKELLNALSCDRDMSELTRGLAHDLQTAFEERALFALAFQRAEQQVVKGEQRRRAQVCDLKDLVQDKDDELSVLRAKMVEVECRVSGQEFALEARDDEIQNKVPELKERINELERIMEHHAMAPSQHHTHVIMDLQTRLEKSAQTAAFYEHHMVKTLFQHDNLQTEWGFYLGGVVDDVQLARGFRDQRDALNIECRALRERFADELLIQPLVVPEGVMTKSEIEEEQLRNMDEGVLKQFLMTYKALPKWLVEPGCPGYEQLRIDVMIPELERQQKEREAIDLSFHAEGQDVDGNESEKVPGDEEQEDCTF